jgi:hypothetical protein
VLVPLDGDGDEEAEPRVAVPARQPDVAYAIARFEQVATGSYLVAFEPVEPA